MVSLAPMEGLTTIYYRRALARWFGGVDRYFTPFLTPTQDHRFTKRELREVLLEHNGGLPTVPQLLTRNAEDFLWAAGELAAMGYREVNLNLGCPSGTVVAKGKGSGFLAHPAELDAFLEEIFSKAPCAISVKTRIGLKDPEEFPVLLAIYRKYPVAELIVHPRVRTDMYKNTPRWDRFGAALENSPFPVCYNGDICTPDDAARLQAAFPAAERLMLGRGLAGDPALARRLKGGPSAGRTELNCFVEQVYESYAEAFGSRRNAMLRMKEVWFYLIRLFQDGDKLSKAIKKARDPLDYEGAVRAVFADLELSPVLIPNW